MIETIAGRINLRVQQLDVKVETKTEDNVFVHVVVVGAVSRPDRQGVRRLLQAGRTSYRRCPAFVFDVVRARVPRIKLDDVFEKKDEIADAVKNELSHVMYDFGYGIVKALVTDIEPDIKVKEAMNEINAAQRLRIAATEKGEAERILRVKSAEAEAQSKACRAGASPTRGGRSSRVCASRLTNFEAAFPGTSAQDVMNLVLMTQYFDTLKEIGATARSNTILIPHSPGDLADLTARVAATQ